MQMTENGNSKQYDLEDRTFAFARDVSVIWVSSFGFVSDFEIRISSLS